MAIGPIHEEFVDELSRRVESHEDPTGHGFAAPSGTAADAILKYLPLVLQTVLDLVTKLKAQ